MYIRGTVVSSGLHEVVSEPLKGHHKEVTFVAFSLDGKKITSGSADKTIRIWDADKGVVLPGFTGHDKEVTSVVFSSDGKHVVSGAKDKTVVMWDTECQMVIPSENS
jgi:WD40 repeat protein